MSMSCRHVITWRDALQLKLLSQPLPQRLGNQSQRAVTSQPAATLSSDGARRELQPKQPPESAIGSGSAEPSGAADVTAPESQGGHTVKGAPAKDSPASEPAATGAPSVKATPQSVPASATAPTAASVRPPADVLSKPADAVDAASTGSKLSAGNRVTVLKDDGDKSQKQEADKQRRLLQDKPRSKAAEAKQALLHTSSHALGDEASKTPLAEKVPHSSSSAVEHADASLPETVPGSAGQASAAVPKLPVSSTESVCLNCIQCGKFSSYRTWTVPQFG